MQRWPGYAPAAHERGVRAVFAFPLQIGAARLGVLALYQAQAMVMVDLGISIADAMARLQAHAFSQNRPLHDVARDIVAGQRGLEADRP